MAKLILLATLLISVTVDMKSQKALNRAFFMPKFCVFIMKDLNENYFQIFIDTLNNLTDNQSQQESTLLNLVSRPRIRDAHTLTALANNTF